MAKNMTDYDGNFTLPNITSVANSSTANISDSFSKEIFILFEFVIVLLELVITVVTALKIPRWIRNHRNQVMAQLIVTNLVRCSVHLVSFYLDRPGTFARVLILYLKFYIDVVIMITFCFFVKHIYETLILVIVKINQKKVYTIFWISWLVPAPLAVAATVVVETGHVEPWTMRLLLCSIFKWPLMFLGTVLYVIILYRVLTEKIRIFARSLSVITFLLCFLLNFYILFKDIIHLWCFRSFRTVLISYTVGLTLNFLGLNVYVTYITLCYKSLNVLKKNISIKVIQKEFIDT